MSAELQSDTEEILSKVCDWYYFKTSVFYRNIHENILNANVLFSLNFKFKVVIFTDRGMHSKVKVVIFAYKKYDL